MEVGLHREVFDDISEWVGHQTTHTRQLRDLFDRTTCSGCRNNRNRVEAVDMLDDLVSDLSRSIRPELKHTLFSLCRRQHSLAVLLVGLVNCGLRITHDSHTGLRRLHVRHREGDAGTGCPLEAGLLKVIKELDRTLCTIAHVNSGNQTGDLLLVHRDIDPEGVRNDLVEDHTSDGCCEQRLAWALAVQNILVKVDLIVVVCIHRVPWGPKDKRRTVAQRTLAELCKLLGIISRQETVLANNQLRLFGLALCIWLEGFIDIVDDNLANGLLCFSVWNRIPLVHRYEERTENNVLLRGNDWRSVRR